MAKLLYMFVLCSFSIVYASDDDVTTATDPKEISMTAGYRFEINKCPQTSDDNRVTWTLSNGLHVNTDDRVSAPKNGSLVFNPVQVGDENNYTCTYQNGSSWSYNVGVAEEIKLPSKSVIVVEKETLRLDCIAKGFPRPVVTWTKKLPNSDEKKPLDSERVNFTGGEGSLAENSSLVISTVAREDRGLYECCVDMIGYNRCFQTNVRVKDIYSALWPFLGIVAEVVVLCLIIFIYEKRRTKQDLDESDTDQASNTKGARN